MKDYGWDIRYALLLFLAMVISAPLFIYAPLVLLIIVSITLFLAGLRQTLRYRNLATWTGVPGELINTSMGRYRVSIGQYSRPEEYYFPLALFKYHYKYYTGESSQYAFDRKSIWSTDRETTEKLIAKLDAQKSVQVFVNPRKPAEAVLNKEISSMRWSHAWALLLSGVLLATSALILWQYQ